MDLNREDDPAKQKREYMREYMRARRAKEKLEAMSGGGGKPKATTQKTIVRKRTRQVIDVDTSDLIPLEEADKLGYQIGTRALSVAMLALESLDEAVREGFQLRTEDIKRLADIGLKFRREFGAALAVEESEEEQLIMTAEVLGSDDAIDGLNQILRATAVAELQIDETGRQEARAELSGGICESGEPWDVDSV